MSRIFGPVPSRRLGRSMGIDLVPFKTCTYDCIYCQLGRTTCKTVERREWVPMEDVLAELKDKLSSKPDYITLSGSGEPTLYSRLGELIARIRSITPIPVAVLTNGSLLWMEEVRAQLMDAQLVLPSLDAGNVRMFEAVNRPHESISFAQMLGGLISLRKEFKKAYWLEVFLLTDHFAAESEIESLARCVRWIQPDRVQLNTATRPTAEGYALKVSQEDLARVTERFDPVAEVIADYRGTHEQSDFKTGRDSVLEMLQRRPCSVDDVASGLRLHRNEVIKYIEDLNAEGWIEQRSAGNTRFYGGRRRPETKPREKENPHGTTTR